MVYRIRYWIMKWIMEWIMGWIMGSLGAWLAECFLLLSAGKATAMVLTINNKRKKNISVSILAEAPHFGLARAVKRIGRIVIHHWHCFVRRHGSQLGEGGFTGAACGSNPCTGCSTCLGRHLLDHLAMGSGGPPWTD